MKRERPNYIDTRISQLKEEMLKPNNEYDRSWYNRLIQELEEAQQMETYPTKNCYMEEKNSFLYR